MWVCPQCQEQFADGKFCPADGNALRFARGSGTIEIAGLRIERELGRGLTGTVYRARREDGEEVAVKVLHREWTTHHEMLERFLREARAASLVSHPRVVAPLACGTLDDGRPYIVMELVDGPSLDEVLALGPLPESRAAAIGADLASALAAVHRAGVVHRDVKPGNVRIGADGRARLLDFGVARRLDAEDEARLTQGGLTVGTPHYMAPEQCVGDAQSGRTDVYALGCVLYRMLTGVVPFDGTGVAVMLQHASREPVPVSERAAVSPALARLVSRCLAKRAEDRPDAEQLAHALERIAPVNPRASTALPYADLSFVPVPVPAPAPLPDPSSAMLTIPAMAPRRRPFLRALVLLALLAGAVALFVRVNLRGAELHAALHLPPTPPPITADARRYLVASDDGVALRLGAPPLLAMRTEHELTIEVWDADGEPLDTADLGVTFAAPDGQVIGLAADPTRERGVYRVRIRFDRIGDWTVRVFPPRADAMVTFHLEVGAARPAS